MISHRGVYRRLVVIGFALFVLSGCATATRMPIKLDPSFSEMEIQAVTLLPVVDRRVDKSYVIEVIKFYDIMILAKKILEEKGYSVLTTDTFAEGKVVESVEVAEMDVKNLALLGPKDAKVIVLIYIDDIASNYKVMYYTFKIEATCSMILKEKQTELWRGKAIGKSGSGGLISGLFQGSDQSQAISSCINDLFSSLPPRDGK